MSIDGGLRPIFRERLRSGFHWQSVETAMTGRGVADSNFCSKGIEGWIEFKWTDGWAVTLDPFQVGWITTRVRHGGRVFIAVRRWCDAGPRRPAADELWLLKGYYARELKSGGLRGAPPASVIGVWPGGPSRWSWPEVAAHLLAR